MILRAVEQRTGITPLGQGVVVLAVLTQVLGRAVHSAAVVLLAYGALAFFGLAWALGRRRLGLTAVRSSFPSRLREGQGVEVSLGLSAVKRVTAIVVEERLPAALGRPVRVPVAVLAPGQSAVHAYRLSAGRRGVHSVGPLVAEWSDPFGLTRHRVELVTAASLIVHPSTEPVTDRIASREWEDPPVRPPVSKPWPTGFEFYGMRDYVSGDDPRRIVWRVAARSEDPRYVVREAEQGITDRVRLFLDTDQEWHSPASSGQPSETFELAVRAAASLASKHLHDGFAVSVDANDRRLAAGVRGRTGTIPMLDALAGVSVGRAPLKDALGRLLYEPGGNAHNVVITPHLDRDTATRLRLLLERGTSLLLVMVLWEASDFASLHRAGSLGCNVVEVGAGVPLERVFQRVVRAVGR
ncbi:MAG TPA: DUF58 domain-containing protein [Acidimicrobiales bacterium]|jgi:uncharacterized protein (DUF58 family)|nr:DUF58 domain-containing protein [Acidimicrobiales bacterium]